MESMIDILKLPTHPECQWDRNFHYPCPYRSDDPVEYEDPTRWRRERDRVMMEKYHYDTILRIKQAIEDQDKRINQLSNGANAAARIRIVQGKKQSLLKELQMLVRGWEEIAAVLTEESRKLFVLPLEIRQKVYGYLYTRRNPEPLYLEYPDVDVRRSVLPRDPFLYLNASVVDPVIAAEAADVLYDTNSFHVVGHSSWGNRNMLSCFLNTDHFGSNIIPKDALRRLHINLDLFYTRRQASLASVLEMTSLKVLSLSIDKDCDSYDSYFRDISPIIWIIQRQGVVVRVSECLQLAEGPRTIDVSYRFGSPSPADWELAQVSSASGSNSKRTKEEKMAIARVAFARDQAKFEQCGIEGRLREILRKEADLDSIYQVLKQL